MVSNKQTVFVKEYRKERIEHPNLKAEVIKQIVKDHLAKKK
jgi:hypothetical protein